MNIKAGRVNHSLVGKHVDIPRSIINKTPKGQTHKDYICNAMILLLFKVLGTSKEKKERVNIQTQAGVQMNR